MSQANLICGTWNICRGLVTRENELIQLLDKEKIDILFLTETDTSKIESENEDEFSEFFYSNFYLN